MTQLKLISDYHEVEQAFETFKSVIADQGQIHADTHVGWPGGYVVKDVYWFADAGIWCLPQRVPPKKRDKTYHWICFGIVSPEDALQHSITVEINPPHAGSRKGPSGAFLTDDQGQLFIAHSGKVGGGRKGMTREAFLNFCSLDPKQHVPERNQDMFAFGPIGSKGWIVDLGQYVREVASFKTKFKRPS